MPEIPGLRYSWNRDETLLRLTYDGPHGRRRNISAFLEGDEFRDEEGRVIGRVIGGNRIAIDVLAVLPDLLKDQDEPRLCPAYAPDVAGSDQGKRYDENRARQYEDFVKWLINPPPNGPTPSGYVYYLTNPETNELVSYDDCHRLTGILVEIKGLGSFNLISGLRDVMADKYLKQALRQVAASGGRPVVRIFAEKGAADFARELFDANGLKQITVVEVPWTRSERQ